MNASVSHVYADGIIAICKLPFVRFLDSGSLDLMDLKLIPIADLLKFAPVDTINKFQNKYVLYIGSSGGMPFYLVTSLSAQELQQLLFDFIGQSKVSDIGFVNIWLADGLRAAHGNLSKMVVNKFSKLVVTVQLLQSFSRWVTQRLSNDKAVLGGIFWFGMQMSAHFFLKNWSRMVLGSEFIVAHIILTVEIKSTSDVPCIVTMNQEVQLEFGGQNTKWRHPLGLIDAVSCEVEAHSRMAIYFASVLEQTVNSIKIYQSELKKCCPPKIKLQRASCAAAALIGGQWVHSDKEYKEQCDNVYHWAECIDSGLHCIYQNGSVLCFEILMPLGSRFCSDNLNDIRHEVKVFFEQNNRLVLVPAKTMPYHESILPAVCIVKNASIGDLRKVVTAEAYLRYLIDGDTAGTYYPGLKAALGMTVENAYKGYGEFIAPLSTNLDHVTWDDIHIDKLATPIAFFLQISADSVHKMLKLIAEKYHHGAPPGDKCHGLFWIEMLKLLIGIETGNQQKDCWSIGHHQQNGQLVGSISPQRLVDVLLCHSLRQDTNKLRVLARTLIQSYLDRAFSEQSEEQKKIKLGSLIQEQVFVFPHSMPVSATDRLEKWWLVGADPDARLLENTLVWIRSKLVCSFELVPNLTKMTINNTLVGTGWYLINRFLDSTKNVCFGGCYQWYVRATWLVILAISQEQIRRNDYLFHVDLPWAEWNTVMGTKLDQILSQIKTWSILINAPTGTSKLKTVFGLYQVPKKMPERLEQLRAHFVKIGIVIEDNNAPRVTSISGHEIAPAFDIASRDETHFDVVKAVKRYKKPASVKMNFD